MSVSFDYFFQSEKGLAELGQQIDGWLGCSLEPYQGNESELYGRFLAMEFSLRAAGGYENDRELDFQSFGFELGIRIPVPDADLRLVSLPAMLAAVYVLYRRLGITGMLVYDTQRLLARYGERTGDAGKRSLFDLVSGRAFDSFSRHLADVEARLSTE
ncbi:MAG: hypothetical protein C4321_10770 [Chloroflexota bacterium]